MIAKLTNDEFAAISFRDRPLRGEWSEWSEYQSLDFFAISTFIQTANPIAVHVAGRLMQHLADNPEVIEEEMKWSDFLEFRVRRVSSRGKQVEGDSS